MHARIGFPLQGVSFYAQIGIFHAPKSEQSVLNDLEKELLPKVPLRNKKRRSAFVDVPADVKVRDLLPKGMLYAIGFDYEDLVSVQGSGKANVVEFVFVSPKVLSLGAEGYPLPRLRETDLAV